MLNNHKWGYVLGAVWLAGILFIGLHVQGMAPDMKIARPADPKGATMNIQDPKLIQDKMNSQQILAVASKLEDDYEYVAKRYDQIPPFVAPSNSHLTSDNITNLIGSYNHYVREFKTFKRKVVGDTPGLFSAIAFYGMHEAYHLVLKRKSLAANGITEEEFFWTSDRMFEAALFCVEHTLKHEQMDEAEEKYLKDINKQLHQLTGVKKEMEGGAILYDRGKLNDILATTPRNNIELFLDHYHDFNWHKIHFDTYEIKITLNREAILAAAANNPP